MRVCTHTEGPGLDPLWGCPPAPASPKQPPGPTYILMLHVFQQQQLPISPLGKDLGLEGPAQLLDGHLLP